MKKSFLIFLVTPFAISCSKMNIVTKEECLATINALTNKYDDLNNIPLDIFIDTKENGIVKQYAYDSKHKMYYQFINDAERNRKWQYFDNDLLYTLHEYKSNESTVRVKWKEKQIAKLEESYFKEKEIKPKIIQMIDAILNTINLSNKEKEEYLKGHSRNYQIKISKDNIKYTHSFFDYQLGENKIEYIVDGKVSRVDIYNFHYEKFETTVNPDEFREI